MVLVPPRRVMDKKSLAWILWLAALAFYLVYVITLITTTVAQRDDPPTSSKYKLVDSLKLPAFWICHASEDMPMNEDHLTDVKCFTGDDPATGTACSYKPETINLAHGTEDTADNRECLVFNAGLEVPEATSTEGFLNINIEWDDDKIGADVDKEDMINAVVMSFYENDNEKYSNYVYAPTGFQNQVSLAKISTKKLGESAVVSFDAKSASAVQVDASGNTNINAYELNMRLHFSSFLVLEVEEVDPVNVNTLLGSIGGAWVYVGLLFGLLFASNPRTGEIWFRLNPNRDTWKALAKAAYAGAQGDVEMAGGEVGNMKANEIKEKK